MQHLCRWLWLFDRRQQIANKADVTKYVRGSGIIIDSQTIYDIYIQAAFQSFKDSNKFSSLKRNSFFKCVLQFQWALASSWLRRRQIKSQESKNIFLTSIQLSLKYNVKSSSLSPWMACRLQSGIEMVISSRNLLRKTFLTFNSIPHLTHHAFTFW